MSDEEDTSTIPVYACSRGDLTDDEKPIGRAENEKQAARMIRKFLSERDGDDYGLRARDIYYSAQLNAYFTEE